MSASTSETSLVQDYRNALRYWFGGRRGAILAAIVVTAGSGLWFGWPSLVAAGLAPLILAMAPCAVMCALGLCMNMRGRTDLSSGAADRGPGSALPRASADSEADAKTFGGCCGDGHSQTETKAPR